MDPALTINQQYTKDEIEQIFKTNFGSRIKGITLRRWEDGTPYVIIFSRADGPYDDRVSGDTFTYDGEGLYQDQKLTAANKTLLESNQTGRMIYGFRQESPSGKWRYIGILKVVNHRYLNKNGFMMYEFTMNVV